MTTLTDSLRATAMHESGHAYAAWAQGLALHSVTIAPDPDGLRLGHTRLSHPSVQYDRYDGAPLTPTLRWRIEREIVMLHAGGAAEKRYSPAADPVWATADRGIMAGLADTLTGGDATERMVCLGWFRLRAERLVATPHAAVAIPALADALLAHPRGTLTGREAFAVIVAAETREKSAKKARDHSQREKEATK